MLKKLSVVGLMTVLGVGGLAAPASATTGVWVDVCDPALPGNCNSPVVVSPLVTGNQHTAVYSGDCSGNGGEIPTMDIKCIYVEVDYPFPPV